MAQRKRKSPKRVAAGKKAWRTYLRRRSSGRRPRRRRNPVRARARARPRRNPARRRRPVRRRRRNPVRASTRLYTNPRRRRRAARRNPRRRTYRRRVTRRRNPKLRLFPTMSTFRGAMWSAGGFTVSKVAINALHEFFLKRNMLGIARGFVCILLGTAGSSFLVGTALRGSPRQQAMTGVWVNFGWNLLWQMASFSGIAKNPNIAPLLKDFDEPLDLWSSGALAGLRDYVTMPRLGYQPGGVPAGLDDFVTVPPALAGWAADSPEVLPASGRLGYTDGVGMGAGYYGLD